MKHKLSAFYKATTYRHNTKVKPRSHHALAKKRVLLFGKDTFKKNPEDFDREMQD